jgi:teichuronic acid biosynthesis glycosyltransferase TuaC
MVDEVVGGAGHLTGVGRRPSGPLRVLGMTDLFPLPDEEGRGVFVHERFRSLGSRFQTRVIVFRPGAAIASRTVERRRNGDLEVLVARYPRLPRLGRLWHDTHAIMLCHGRLLRRLVSECDVIYGQFLVPGCVVGAHLSRKAGVPLVSHVCGSDVNVLPSDGHLRNQVRDALGASARVIAAAAVLAERARELGVPDGRVDTVHNGIHDQAFGGTETERQSVVLFVGSLSETKDPLAALRIFSAFTRKSPEARFVLYGEGPMASRVREEAGRLGLRGRVELRGRRPHEEVLAAMKHARVLLNSSRSEGRCNSVLEALASGTPVVAPELPSFHELVSDLEGCLLYPGGDVERGGARLLEAWRGEPDRARISSLVRPYTWAAFGEKVGGILEAAVRDR